MTRARLYWLTALLVLPLVNPPLLLFLGSGTQGTVAVFLALAIVCASNGRLLWVLAARAWQWEPQSRKAALLSSVLIVPAMTVGMAFVEVAVVYLIAAADCPPDAYECPV